MCKILLEFADSIPDEVPAMFEEMTLFLLKKVKADDIDQTLLE